MMTKPIEATELESVETSTPEKPHWKQCVNTDESWCSHRVFNLRVKKHVCHAEYRLKPPCIKTKGKRDKITLRIEEIEKQPIQDLEPDQPLEVTQ